MFKTDLIIYALLVRVCLVCE